MTASRHASRPPFILPVRVYYEDTDSGGVVYYANYLRFLERARTEVLRALGFEQAELARDEGVAFAVRSLQAEYLRPARLDDRVDVVSRIGELGKAQLVFHQRVEREGELLLEAAVRVACLDVAKGKATAIPKRIHDKLKELT